MISRQGLATVKCLLPITALLLAIPSLIMAQGPAEAESAKQWPSWRGPTHDGVSTQARPPVTWSDTKNVTWKTAIPGRGSASPIVWGDRVFITTAVRTDRRGQPAAPPKQGGPRGGGRGRGESPSEIHEFLLICLDRKTGKILWQKKAVETVPHEGIHSTNTYASGSPVTDGKHVYAWFGSHGLHCYDMEGNPKWQRDLGDMRTRNAFGEGGSPALHGNTIVVPFDHEGDSFVAAMNAATGEPLWKTERDEPTTWGTPFITTHQGVTQVILNGARRVRSYDLATGELLWSCGGQATNPIATPVVMDGVVYCMTGYQGYAVYAIPLSVRGDITGSDKIVWSKTDAGPYIASPVLYKGLLYYTKSRDALLLVADAKTGKPVIEPTRLEGLNVLYSSPVAADGRVYYTSRDGATLVLEHGDAVKVLAKNELGEGVDASPALVGRQMFLRGEKHLFCIEEK